MGRSSGLNLLKANIKESQSRSSTQKKTEKKLPQMLEKLTCHMAVVGQRCRISGTQPLLCSFIYFFRVAGECFMLYAVLGQVND